MPLARRPRAIHGAAIRNWISSKRSIHRPRSRQRTRHAKGSEPLASNDSLMECNWKYSDSAGTRPVGRGRQEVMNKTKGKALQSIVMIIARTGGGGEREAIETHKETRPGRLSSFKMELGICQFRRFPRQHLFFFFFFPFAFPSFLF